MRKPTTFLSNLVPYFNHASILKNCIFVCRLPPHPTAWRMFHYLAPWLAVPVRCVQRTRPNLPLPLKPSQQKS
jgi:hypothetical protein